MSNLSYSQLNQKIRDLKSDIKNLEDIVESERSMNRGLKKVIEKKQKMTEVIISVIIVTGLILMALIHALTR